MSPAFNFIALQESADWFGMWGIPFDEKKFLAFTQKLNASERVYVCIFVYVAFGPSRSLEVSAVYIVVGRIFRLNKKIALPVGRNAMVDKLFLI